MFSLRWSGAFHAFFAQRGYHVVCANYGHQWNGHMGVLVAWPISSLECVKVDISRLGERRVGSWPVEPKPSFVASVALQASSLWKRYVASTIKVVIGDSSQAKEHIDHWDFSRRRSNALVSVVLRDKSSLQCFCIGNYHMPCAFYAPMVMTIHADMAARHVRNIAASYIGEPAAEVTTDAAPLTEAPAEPMPYALAGDFNIKPTESVYKLLTTGEISREDPFFPLPKNGVEWSPTSLPLRSAYAVALDGSEPDYTNWARVKENDPFIDTLDYIFIFPSWRVTGVKPLSSREVHVGPFPNLDLKEPSDHVLIAADLEF
jgi:2',5'-phosphodiesterase